MDLKMFRGDSKSFVLALPDAAGNPIDLTGAMVWMTAKEALADDDSGATFQKSVGDGITVLDDTHGVILVELDSADTEDLAASRTRLYYDVQVKDADDKVTTALSGRITVYPDVTITTGEPS